MAALVLSGLGAILILANNNIVNLTNNVKPALESKAAASKGSTSYLGNPQLRTENASCRITSKTLSSDVFAKHSNCPCPKSGIRADLALACLSIFPCILCLPIWVFRSV